MRGVLAMLVLLASCSTAPQQHGGIVSANPCIDAILVELVPSARIAAISNLSQTPDASSMDVRLAQKFRATGGTAEEIIALRPDLALLGSHTPETTVRAVQRAGIKVALIGVPNSIEESLTQIDAIGAAVGAGAKADALKQRISASLPLKNDAKMGQSLLVWAAGGLVPGTGTLIDDMITRAGFRNASRDYGLASWDILPLEPVASDAPDIVLIPSQAKSGEQENIGLRKRYFARFPAETHVVPMPANMLYCGGPTIIRGMALLRGLRPS